MEKADSIGIVNGEEYYIKNIYTEKYLDIQGAGDLNGSKVITYNYTGNNNQKFRIRQNADFSYKLVSVSSSSGRVIDITGSTVDIWQDN